MSKTNHMLWATGLAIASSCLAQPAQDTAKANHDELAASVAANSSFLVQDEPTVKISGYMQFRYVINSRDDVPGGGEDTASGFQTRRTKINFSGAVSDNLSYKISGGFSRSSGSITLDDAYGDYKTEKGWKIRGGQFKLPFMREELVSASRQLTAERSTTNAFFSQGRSQGVQVSNSSDKFNWAIAYSDGFKTANTDFDGAGEADYSFTGRVEYMFAGADWNRFRDFTSWSGSEFTGMVGGAVSYQSGGETFNTLDEDRTNITADVSLEGNGWNAFVSATYRTVSPSGSSDLDNSGLVVQGGYLVSPTWELFGRYDILFSDQVDDFSTVTFGVNHFLIPQSHAAKFTGDLVLFLDTQSETDASSSTGTALLASDSDSQFAVRLQMQLVF